LLKGGFCLSSIPLLDFVFQIDEVYIVLVFCDFGLELVVADLPFVKTVKNNVLDEI
jgi:hypothetical protein